MMENIIGLSLDLITHPGETLKEVIENNNISQEELAIRTGYTAKHISEVLNGKKGISNSFAIALEYALGISAEFWSNLQCIYDKNIDEVEKSNNIDRKEYAVLKELKEVVAYLKKINLLSKDLNDTSIILKLRKILNVNNLLSIPNLPIQQVAFRGTKNKINIYVLYAWQKICEILTYDNSIAEQFNKEKLVKRINDIKGTMFLEPTEMIEKLKQIFKECGISFNVVKHFKGAPVQGFIKKRNEQVILCLTIRQSFADIFWFTLFHEIGHLLNDDFKKTYIDYNFIDSKEEKNADEFARNTLINSDEYNSFISENILNIENINKFSKSQNVIPTIIIGRIQNDKKDYSFLTQYKERYTWIEKS